MYARLLEPSQGRRRRLTVLTPSLARHFAVVDACCVDLFCAVSTCPSESSSFSTLRSDIVAVSTEHLTVVSPAELLTVDRTACFFLSCLALLFGHVF
jgi:hypothetical protein